jgi:hypothetical protein
MLTREKMNQDQLKAEFHYDPVTGVFRRRFAKPFSNRRPWSVAGSVATKGYLQISVSGKLFMAHRLAWMYVYGDWPKQQIDHINGRKDDNRIENLRDVSGTVNMLNQTKPRGEKLLGVTWHEDGKKWRARLTINGGCKSLGMFATQEDAHQAYILAKEKLGVMP